MEDQEIMEHFAENKQGYVIDNINAVAGCGIGVGDVLGNTEEIMGVKYDEQLHEQHDVGDDDELKYVKEVQQSEKQHLENVGDGRNSSELAEKENDVDNYEVGLKEENIHNEEHSASMPGNIQIENMFGQLKHMEQTSEDVSSTDVSETIYSGGNTDVENRHEHFEIGKVDDSSLLMVNANTNTNSNSETTVQAFECEKENVSPLAGPFVGGQTDEHVFQGNNFEQSPSQLNPDAKEFVPTFETALKSPNSPNELGETVSNVYENDFFGHVPNAVIRRIGAEDDFVAQSPRKGRGDDMDTIYVPAEDEFDNEANRRPHELEVETEAPIIQDCNKSVSNQMSDEECDDIHREPVAVDHGPETLVDVEVDSDCNQEPQEVPFDNDNQLMKQSIYLTNDEEIENVLNSVQPIPTEIDSVNNSFTEELSNAGQANHNEKDNVDNFYMERPSDVLFGDKELLQVEEKEHISKSPSTEEIQFNLQTSNMDVLSHLSELKDASIMQESLYVDHTVEPDTETVSENKDCSDTINNTNNIIDLRGNEYDLHPSSEEEKHLLEDTKETSNQNISNIDHLMREMDINDNGKGSQVHQNETESHILNDDAHQSDEAPLNDEVHQNESESHILNDDAHEILESPQGNNVEENMFVDELPSKEGTEVEDSLAPNQENVKYDEHIDECVPLNNASEHIDFNSEIPSDSKEDIEILQHVEVKDVPAADYLCEGMIVDEHVADVSSGAAEEPMMKTAATLDDINVLDDLEEMHDQSVGENLEATIEQTFVEESKELTSNEKPFESIPNVENKVEEELICEKRNEDIPQEKHVDSPVDQHINETTFPAKVEAADDHHFPEVSTPATVDLPQESQLKDVTTETQEVAPLQSHDPQTHDAVEDKSASHLNDLTTPPQVEATPVNEAVTAEAVEAPKEETLTAAAVGAAELVGAVKASLPVESSNNAKPVSSKASVKTTTKPSVAKTTPPVRPSAKKVPPTEVAKKTTTLASKPRPAPIKPTTSTTDRKVAKPSSAPTAPARKPLAPSAATAPKVPLKSTITPRSTTSTASSTKTTVSKPATGTRTVTSASNVTARKPATAPAAAATSKPRPATASAVSSKPNTLTSSGTIAAKQNATSPRGTISSTMRKPATTAPTVKSPVKSTVASSLNKTSTSTVGARQKPATTSASVGASSTIKSTTARPAAKTTTSTTTSTTRRLTVGGSTVTSSSTTKTITARNSSPLKPTSGKTQTRPSSSSTNSNTKSAIQAKSSKIIEKKTSAPVAINGDVSSNQKSDTSIVNGISPEPLSTPEDKAALVGNEDNNCSNSNKSENIDQLQGNLIGAFDH